MELPIVNTPASKHIPKCKYEDILNLGSMEMPPNKHSMFFFPLKYICQRKDPFLILSLFVYTLWQINDCD